jgi:hypothetical protein
MIWNAPAALAGLVLLAGPLLVHLLARQQAKRVVFPAMRFVPRTNAAAVRLRQPSDLALLLVRLAIVAAAVLAAARPVLVTPSRQQEWAARLARAVVVDTSPSVPMAPARALAASEESGAIATRRFESPDLHHAIGAATDWLASAPWGRREIVVISDFQLGAIDAGDTAAVPREIGLRFVRAGSPAPAGRASSPVQGWRGGAWTPNVAIDARGTAVTWRRDGDAAAPAVVLRAPEADLAAARRALAAAESLGTHTDGRAIEIAFAGADVPAPAPPRAAWIANAAIALQRHALLAAADPAVEAGQRGDALFVRTTLRATSPLAPALVRATLEAVSAPIVDRELEPGAIDAGTIAAWTRAPQPPPARVPPDVSDGGWLWGVALALLALESWLRRARRAVHAEEAHADAA